MADWAAGLAGGLAGGASAVGMLADNEIKRQNDIILNNNKLDFETRKAAMEDEIKMRAEERARSRLAKYAQGEVDVTTPGAATAVDDEGNSNAVNDIHTKRSKTLEEIRNAMLAGGDTGAANTLDAMVDRTADRESREKVAKLLADNRKSIAEGHDETKLAIQFDKDGTPKATGPGAAQFNRGAMAIQHKIDRQESAVNKMREQLFKLDDNQTISESDRENRKKAIKAEMDAARQTLQTFYKEQDDFIAGIALPKVGMINTPTPGMPSNDKRGTKVMPLPMPASKEQAEAGVWYNTPRGLAMWNGTEFEQ